MILYINGLEWEIQFVEPDCPILFMGDGYTLGVTDIIDRVIYIANNLDDNTLYDVLKHEIAHCYVESYGINMSVPCEEAMCQVIEKYGDDIQDLADEIYMMIL